MHDSIFCIILTSGNGAASTLHGIVIVPPTGARVFAGSGCLSNVGLKAKTKHFVVDIRSDYASVNLFV